VPISISRGYFGLTRWTRLLDKIAKDIMVCENKTVRRWDGSIGEYKNYLRKKMVSMGQV
jgi:ATP-binding cassette, subfamily F, member 2